MRGIADHGVVEIADLDVDAALYVGDRTQVADVAVAANPDLGADGELDPGRPEPFIEFAGRAADIAMRGTRHFGMALLCQDFRTRLWSN